MAKPRVIAIAGAKGGTGKSMVAANIGVFLATLGKKVVLIDAAFGCPTLHSFVGMSEPSRTLAGFFASDTAQLAEFLCPTLITNLRIITGEADPAWAANPRIEQVERLRGQIRKLEADYVVLDLSPGTQENVLDLFLDADNAIVVTTAEPTAVEMSYRFIKASFVRKLRRTELGHLSKMSVEEAREFEGGIPAPSDILARSLARYEEGAEEVVALREHMKALVPHLVLNLARSKGDMELGKDISSAATRRFGVSVPYLGHVEYDDAVWVSLRRRRPLLVEHPESRASKCVEKLTRRIIGLDSAHKHTPPGNSLYDLIEVEPTASEETIRRAHRRIRQVYALDSVVVGGLYRNSRLDSLQRKLDDAYVTLMDPAKRRANDLLLFPDGIPSPRVEPATLVVGAAPAPEERPSRPRVDETTVYSGQVLRELREAKGLDLREIADRSKIGIGYLSAIEEENYAELPALVYVRGFVVEYAKALHLDVERVLDTYLPRFRAARQESVAE